MHGVLFFILKELIAIKDPLCQKFDLAFHLDHCEQNFITAIETYEVLAVPSFENILALTMGVSTITYREWIYMAWSSPSNRLTKVPDAQIPGRRKALLVSEARFCCLRPLRDTWIPS